MSAYFRTLRHVYRFSGPFEFLLRQMKSGESFELNFVDMLGLETLRIFEPALYNRLRIEKEFACGGDDFWEYLDEKETARRRRKRFDEMISLVPEQRRRQAEIIVKALFPLFLNPEDNCAGGMEKALRIGHRKTFARYFLMGIPDEDVSQAAMDALVRVAGEPKEFESLWKVLREEGKEAAAISRLGIYHDQIPVSALSDFITALCNIGDDMPKTLSYEGWEFHAARRSSEHIAAILKSRIKDVDERCLLLKQSISASRGIRVPVCLTPLSPDQKEERRDGEIFVSDDGARVLIDLLLQRLSQFAEDGRLRASLELPLILHRWARWGGAGKVKDWLTKELQSAEDALWFLACMVYKNGTLGGSVGSEQKTTYRRTVPLKSLEEWRCVEKLANLTEGVELSSLSQDQFYGLRAFRYQKRLKDEGKPFDERGSRWEDDPLTDFE